MKRWWGCLIIAIVLVGCGTKLSLDIEAVNPHDMTLTSVFTPSSGISAHTETREPRLTPDPNLCTAYNALGNDVYLRNFPAAEQDIIATWQPDVPLEVLGRTDSGWYFVRIVPNGRGWVDEKPAHLVGTCDKLPVLTSANLRVPSYKLPCRVSSATGGIVSLHNLPTMDSQIVGELPQGYLMQTVQRTAGGWYYVTDFLHMLPSGWNQGWVYESSLHRNGPCDITSGEPPTHADAPLSNSDTSPKDCSALNSGSERGLIYVNADPDSQVLSWIYPGETVRISLQNSDGWIMAEYDSFRGWVRKQALELSGDCSQLPGVP